MKRNEGKTSKRERLKKLTTVVIQRNELLQRANESKIIILLLTMFYA